nr:MAG TPA: hypothetical protein [Caudoviricetes sp.]
MANERVRVPASECSKKYSITLNIFNLVKVTKFN